MDCKMENAAVSVVRIEAIVLQGVVKGLLTMLVALLAMPFNPLILIARRARWARKMRLGFWSQLARIPLWMLEAVAFSLLAPLWIGLRTIADCCTIAQVEWNTRWKEGTPKLLNGHPVPMPSSSEVVKREVSLAMGVLEDYGEAP